MEKYLLIAGIVLDCVCLGFIIALVVNRLKKSKTEEGK